MRNEPTGEAFNCSVFWRFSAMTRKGTQSREWEKRKVFPCCWEERCPLAPLPFPTFRSWGDAGAAHDRKTQ